MTASIAVCLILLVAGAAVGRWPVMRLINLNIHDHSAISRRAISPLVMGLLSLCWGLFGWRVVAKNDMDTFVPLLVFGIAAVVLTIVDLIDHRLPNVIVGGTTALILLLFIAAWAGDPLKNNDRILWALLGMVSMFLVYLLLGLSKALGVGDIKLAALIGLVVGWCDPSAILIALAAAFVLGGFIALVMLACHRTELTGSIPFGPSMLAGAALGVIFA